MCEDADLKTLLNAMNTVANSPSADKLSAISNLGRALNNTIAATIPFANLLVRLINSKEKSDIDKVIAAVSNATEIRSRNQRNQQRYFYEVNLPMSERQYQVDVSSRIDAFNELLALWALSKFEIDMLDLKMLNNHCENEFNTITSANNLAKFIRTCKAEGLLNSDIFEEIHRFIRNAKYIKREDNHEIRRLTSHLYYYLQNFSTQQVYQILKKFSLEQKEKYDTKKHFLLHLLDYLDIDLRTDISERCIFKQALLLASGHKTTAVTRLTELMADDILHLGYHTALCSVLGYHDKPNFGLAYIRRFKESIEPVIDFLTTWPDKLLDHMWPRAEMALVENYLSTIVTPRNNITVRREAVAMFRNINEFGHPSYEKQVLISTYDGDFDDDIEENNLFYYKCEDLSCQHIKKDSYVVLIVRLNRNKFASTDRQHQLLNYTDGIRSDVLADMERVYYFRKPVGAIMSALARKYRINNFSSHDGYVVLRTNRFRSGCYHTFSLATSVTEDELSFPSISYYYEGYGFDYCNYFLFMFF